MLAKQVTSYTYGRTGTFASHKQAVERVIKAMHERLDESLSLEDMADIAILSPYHFNRVFRQITGIPPSQFLYALRLQAAKRLLLTSQLRVTDVCFEVGYNSLGTFSTRFSQLVGLPPQHLRGQAEETTTACLKSLRDHHKSRPDAVSGQPTLTGQIGADEDFAGLIFVGLFPTSIPQSRPVGCTLLTRPGPYRIGAVPDGQYYMFVLGLPWSDDPMTYLLLEDGKLQVGADQGPLLVRGGQIEGDSNITLRPMQLTDPPVLTALPFLLEERLALEDNGHR